VHSVVYLITHTNTRIYILFKKSKIYIKTVKTLLHISITLRSTRRTTITRLILNSVRLTHKNTTCCHSIKV